MQSMTIWKKCNHQWEESTPDYTKLTAKDFIALANTRSCIKWQDYTGTYYAYGDDFSKERLQQKHISEPICLMDMESFGMYWMYKLLEFGVSEFSKSENTAERRAIMEVEGVPQSEIEAQIARRPDIHVQSTFEWPEDF